MKLATRLLGIVFLAGATLAGCHELGHIDGIGDYGGIGSGDVVGEIQHVDTRAREIEIRTDAGPTSVVRYDDRTQVLYRQRNYSVDNLETGDYVAARVQQDRDGRGYYTDTITVRESVQDRGGPAGSGRFDRVNGRKICCSSPDFCSVSGCSIQSRYSTPRSRSRFSAGSRARST